MSDNPSQIIKNGDLYDIIKLSMKASRDRSKTREGMSQALTKEYERS